MIRHYFIRAHQNFLKIGSFRRIFLQSINSLFFGPIHSFKTLSSIFDSLFFRVFGTTVAMFRTNGGLSSVRGAQCILSSSSSSSTSSFFRILAFGCVLLSYLYPSTVFVKGINVPNFSWDYVPQFIHCSNRSGPLNDAILDAMSQPSVGFTVIEKYQSVDCAPFNSDGENKELAAAAQIKGRNPQATVIFYFAIDYARTWYNIGHYFDNNTYLEVHNADGTLATVNSEGYTWHVFDFAVPEAQLAWVNVLVNVLSTKLVDGVFIDGYRSPSGWTNGLIPKANESEQINWLQGAYNLSSLVGSMLPPDSIRIINPGSEFSVFPGYNAVSIEFFDGSLGTVQQLYEYNNGTLVEVHTYAGTNEKLFNQSLAGYLVAAGPNTYFGAGSTWDTCDSWLIPHIEYTKPLGEPLGLANITDNGMVWTRQFTSGTIAIVNATVTNNLYTCIIWGDGYRTGC